MNTSSAQITDTDLFDNLAEEISSGGDDEKTDEAARQLYKTLHRLKEHLKGIDTEAIEILGLNAKPFQQVEDDLEEVFGAVRKHGSEVLSKASAAHQKIEESMPMWEVEVASFTSADQSYIVRWDIDHYPNKHIEEGEEIDSPRYSCTCKSFIFGNHDGKWCKHIDSVRMQEGGSEGKMPDDATKIGTYIK